MASQEVHISIPGTCMYVTLHGKRYFVGVIKLKILWWRLSFITQLGMRWSEGSLEKWDKSSWREGKVAVEAEIRVVWP